MSCNQNYRFRFLLSAILVVIAALIVVACAPKEVKEEVPAVEAPPAKVEEKPAPAPLPPPPAKTAAKEAPAPPVAPKAVPAAPVPEVVPAPPPAPAVAPARAPGIPEQYKGIDPSLLIYLSERGVLGGTGDPTGVAGEAEKMGMAPHPAAMELAKLPKDKYGLVDWAVAIKTGMVKPLDSLEPGAVAAPPFNLDIVIQTKSNFMNDVVFPHYTHTLWLTCTNCHTQIFQMKAGAHPEMTMPKIASGQYCGRCHNRVAFPLTDCTRCHVKPKETASPSRQK